MPAVYSSIHSWLSLLYQYVDRIFYSINKPTIDLQTQWFCKRLPYSGVRVDRERRDVTLKLLILELSQEVSPPQRVMYPSSSALWQVSLSLALSITYRGTLSEHDIFLRAIGETVPTLLTM